METNQTESVTQSEISGAKTEPKTEALSKADLDFKKDMLRYKDEANQLKDQLKSIELEKQEKKGNYEGVITSLKDEIKSLKGKIAKKDYDYANTQINSAIKEEALARDIKGSKLDVLMKLVDQNDKGAVSLDDRYNVDMEDVKGLVDKNLERYSDIFKKTIKIADGTPTNNPPTSSKKADPNKMSAEELKEYILKNG